MRKLIFPSFGMTLETYDTQEKVVLKGENNWYSLILTHFLIIASIGFTIFSFRDILDSTVFSRMSTFFIALILGQFIYNQIKGGRNEKYIKREIRFEKDGIHLNHSKKSEDKKLITKERIRRIVLITNGIYFKFAINGSDQPDFQFYVKPNEQNGKFKPEEFIEMLKHFYNLEGNKGLISNVKISMMLTRIKTEEDNIARTDSNLAKNLQKEEKNQRIKPSRIEGRDDPKSEDYKARHLFRYGKNGEWMIEQISNDDVIGVKKLRISRKDKLIWHKKNIFKL